jgi:hypothetical protein
MSRLWCESPGNAARIAALSADQAPTAIIGCQHMTKPSSIIRSALGGIIGVVLAAVTAVPGGDSSLCPSGWICPAMPIMSPSIKVGTWYELYWQTPDSTWPGQHWALWTRYKPVGGYYRSGDPSVVQSQFAQIKAAGIDYVLLDDTNGIWNDNGEIEKNAKSISIPMTSFLQTNACPLRLSLEHGGIQPLRNSRQKLIMSGAPMLRAHPICCGKVNRSL